MESLSEPIDVYKYVLLIMSKPVYNKCVTIIEKTIFSMLQGSAESTFYYSVLILLITLSLL